MTQAQNLNIVVREEPPPEEYTGKNLYARVVAVVTQARALKPGQWFEWPKPPGNWKKRHAEFFKGLPVVCYRTSDKRVVVRHKEAGRPAETPKTAKPESVIATIPTAPTANYAGVGVLATTGGVPNAPKPRAILAAMARVGSALNMGELANKVGTTGLAEAIDQLRTGGYVSIDVVRGKALYSLTPKGFEAGKAINDGGGV